MKKETICQFLKRVIFGKKTEKKVKKAILGVNKRAWSEDEEHIFYDINSYRAEPGDDEEGNPLPQRQYLQKDDILKSIADTIAQMYADNGIAVKYLGGHIYFPETTQMLSAMGLHGAENLASHYGFAQSTINGWIASEGHRDNILKDWTHTGVSVKTDTKGFKYYLQLFSK